MTHMVDHTTLTVSVFYNLQRDISTTKQSMCAITHNYIHCFTGTWEIVPTNANEVTLKEVSDNATEFGQINICLGRSDDSFY